MSAGLPSAFASPYAYDQDKSKLVFTLRHLGMVTVQGEFRKFTGSFEFDPENIEGGSVHLTIEADSLNSANSMRDQDLRSKSFFWVEKHPKITFVSKMFKVTGNRKFNIYGDLTIKGITVPVEFQTEMLTAPSEIAPDKPIHFHTHTYIRRKDFKLGTGGFFNPIMIVTAETLKLSLDVEGRPQRA